MNRISRWLARRRRWKRFRRELRRRSEEEWCRVWEEEGVNAREIEKLFRELSNVMGWPSHYIFPGDGVADVFLNPTLDMREIDSMLRFEQRSGIQVRIDREEKMIDLIS